MTETDPMPIALPYGSAPPPPSADQRMRAAKWLVGGGVALAVVGGCFLIGVLILSEMPPSFSAPGPPAVLKPREYLLMAVLYLMAFACFGTAVLLLWRGVRGLVAIMNGD